MMNNYKWELLIKVAFLLFCLSTLMLIIASTATWSIKAGEVTPFGVIDVVTAFVVIILGIIIYGKGIKLAALSTWKTSYIVAMFLPVSILVVIWLAMSQILIRIDILLPGLAWRFYIFFQTLPAALAILDQKESNA
jgi:hypothetical protein